MCQLIVLIINHLFVLTKIVVYNFYKQLFNHKRFWHKQLYKKTLFWLTFQKIVYKKQILKFLIPCQITVKII